MFKSPARTARMRQSSKYRLYFYAIVTHWSHFVSATHRIHWTVNRTAVRRNRAGTDRSGETVASVVSRICGAVQTHSLDAILIFAHGHHNSDESIRDGYTEPTIKLGIGLTKTTASEFSRITYLWHRSYEPDCQTDFRVVVPRIELHVCYAAEAWNRPVVQALARAARATVFASQVTQRVDNLAFEGRVLPFQPLAM